MFDIYLPVKRTKKLFKIKVNKCNIYFRRERQQCYHIPSIFNYKAPNPLSSLIF